MAGSYSDRVDITIRAYELRQIARRARAILYFAPGRAG